MPWVGTWVAGALGATGAAATVIATVVNVALLTVVQRAFTPKVRFNQSSSVKRDLTGRTLNSRGSIANRQYVYGQVRVGGQIVLLETSGANNQDLHMVVAHCSHEVEELGDLYINDELVPLTGNAPSSGNKYEDHLRVYSHTGSDSQTVDTVLDAALSRWTTSHRLRGIAYTYCKLTIDRENNVWPGGLPTINRVVKGRKVWDPRSSTTAYSANAALCMGDFLTSEFGYGRYGLAVANIADTEWQAAANVCDEAVTLADNEWTTGEYVNEGTKRTSDSGPVKLYIATSTGTTGATAPTGTGTGIDDDNVTWDYVETFTDTEARYEINGVVTSGEDPRTVVNKMKKSMSGFAEYIGGEWVIHAGEWRAPTVTLSESDFAGPISGATKDDRRSAANRVKGVFSNAGDKYNVVEFPAVTNATYLSEDNSVESWRDIDLPYTTSAAAAQRLAKIHLEKGRQQITHTATFTLKAMRIQAGDVFSLTFSKYGYSSKAFVCISHQLKMGEVGALQVDMTFRETASTVFTWANGEETVLDPAPNTTLPDPFTVSAPTIGTIASGTKQLVTQGGIVRSRIFVPWTAGAEAHVSGHEIQWKKRHAFSVSAITQANPAVVTFTETHDYLAGDVLDAYSIGGMTELNDSSGYIVANPTGTTIELQGVDSTSYGAYTSGGWFEETWDAAIAVPMPSTAFWITDVEDGIDYDIRIRAFTSIAKSAWDTVYNHTVVGKSAAPAVPTGLAATAGVKSVTLTVDESSEADHALWRIYQNTTDSIPASYSHITTDTIKTITGLTAGQIYYFWMIAVDTTGNTSTATASVNATPTAVVVGDIVEIDIEGTDDQFTVDTDGIVTLGKTPSGRAFQIKRTGSTIAMYLLDGAGGWESEWYWVDSEGAPAWLIKNAHSGNTGQVFLDGEGNASIRHNDSDSTTHALSLFNNNNTWSVTVDEDGKLVFGGSILGRDTYLYRPSAGVFKTDGDFLAQEIFAEGNVYYHGADPAGSASANTTAFQAAIDSGYPVVVPYGDFDINDDLIIGASNTSIFLGANAIINQTANDKSIFSITSKDNVWIQCNGAVLFGEGSWSSGWTGNSASYEKVVEFINCTNSGITDAVIKNGANAGLYIEACENFRGTNLIIEGTHTHGVTLASGVNFQNGIYVKNSSTHGNCRDVFLTFDISGTAQGVLIESYSTYAPDGDSIYAYGVVHDITGQHGFYVQAGNVNMDVVCRDIELDGIKVQVPGALGSEAFIDNVHIRASVHNCGSHAVELQHAGGLTGSHDGSSGAAVLTDSGESWTTDEHVGKLVINTTDKSIATITANDESTITGTLTGGTDNDWDASDAYVIFTGGIANVNIDLVAKDCQRGIGINRAVRGVNARVTTQDCDQYAAILQGADLQDIDIHLISRGSTRDAVELDCVNSKGIRIHPTIREPADTGGTYDGIKIGSICNTTEIEIHNPTISDSGSNHRYGIYNESSTATFGIYGKVVLRDYGTNAIRTGTELLAFPTDFQTDDLKTAFHDRTLIQGPHPIYYEVQTTSTSQATLCQKTLDDESTYRIISEVVAHETDISAAGFWTQTVCYRRTGGTVSLVGSVENLSTPTEDGGFGGNYVGWGISGANVRIRVASDSTETINWKAKVTATKI